MPPANVAQNTITRQYTFTRTRPLACKSGWPGDASSESFDAPWPDASSTINAKESTAAKCLPNFCLSIMDWDTHKSSHSEGTHSPRNRCFKRFREGPQLLMNARTMFVTAWLMLRWDQIRLRIMWISSKVIGFLMWRTIIFGSSWNLPKFLLLVSAKSAIAISEGRLSTPSSTTIKTCSTNAVQLNWEFNLKTR